jgi:hypothetical protein
MPLLGKTSVQPDVDEFAVMQPKGITRYLMPVAWIFDANQPGTGVDADVVESSNTIPPIGQA